MGIREKESCTADDRRYRCSKGTGWVWNDLSFRAFTFITDLRSLIKYVIEERALKAHVTYRKMDEKRRIATTGRKTANGNDSPHFRLPLTR